MTIPAPTSPSPADRPTGSPTTVPDGALPAPALTGRRLRHRAPSRGVVALMGSPSGANHGPMLRNLIGRSPTLPGLHPKPPR